MGVQRANSNTPNAVFRHRNDAERWIATDKLTGMLTLYRVDIPVYDWAIKKGYFMPKRADQSGAVFVGRFSSESQEHYHYEDGHEKPYNKAVNRSTHSRDK